MKVGLHSVEPEQFGAVGDGSKDDTQAIKDAIALMDEIGGGRGVIDA